MWLKANVFTVFLISRIIGGLTKGSVTLCTTMMSDITTKENRGKGMVGTYAYHINAYNAYIFLLVFINWLGF